jgi:hypothetical protein
MLIAEWLLDTEHVDGDQIERLLDLQQRPNVDLRVIEGKHLLPVGASFTIVTPPGNAEPTLVAEFNLLGPAYHEGSLAIADFSSLFGTLTWATHHAGSRGRSIAIRDWRCRAPPSRRSWSVTA